MADPIRPSWPAGTRRLRVHDLLIDLRYRRVIRPDGEAELPQRMFDLLLLFLAEPQVLHQRAELFARVWPGVIVEDANLSQSVWMLRRALGDARKHWIRTVAKGGYVFEPPAPVVVEEPSPADAPASAPAAIATAPAPQPDTAPVETATPPVDSGVATLAPPARGTPWGRRFAAFGLLLALLLAGGGYWWLQRGPSAPTPASARPPLAVALIDVEDPAAPKDSRWPVTLLHAWLGWKLDSLPEVTLLTEANLAGDASQRAPTVVFLSSGVDSINPSRVFLRARFDAGGRAQRLEKVGTSAQLPAMADALSDEVLDALVPARADEPWPTLALDTAAARRYAAGVDAMERRNWVESAAILQDVARQAPRFGLARVQLGYTLMRQSRAAPSIEQTNAGVRLLQPVPADVAQVLEAERLSRDPHEGDAAAEAWGALARRYPQKRQYTLEQASRLNLADRPREALALLDRPEWDREPAAIRLRHRLNLAAAYLSLGDPKRARDNALAAEHIAAAAGEGWGQERGDALLLAAQADYYQYEDKADLKRFEAAAQQFEAVGNDMDALYARFLAESSRRDSAPDSGLDALLVQARERGYRRLEIDMLRLVAYRHFERGEMGAYRARLEQALALALTAGDLYEERQLELDLLNEDFLRGRFDSAERRVANLNQAGLQGDTASWLSSFEAVILGNRGRLRDAVRVLDAAEKRDRADNPRAPADTGAATRIACVRADIRLMLGDLPGARSGWAQCAASESPSQRLQAQIGNASVDLAAGDRTAALRQAQAALAEAAKMPDGPDRWATELWIANLLTRAGDPAGAERLFRRVLPLARATQYEWIIAITETGLAETAAARGDWAAVRTYVAAARRPELAGIWTLSNRIDVLDALASLQQGDPQRALQRLSAVHAQAVRNGDAITQMEVHSLLPPGMAIGDCNTRCQSALVARTGLRGSTLDWLVVPAKVDTEALLATLR